MLPKAAEKIKIEAMTVVLPEDIMAKKESKERLKGTAVHSSLHQLLHDVHALEKQGINTPPELIAELKTYINDPKLQKSLDQNDLEKVMMTIDTLEHINEVQDYFEDDEDTVKVHCACVNGECKKGESKCNKCYKGWKGKLCDISDDKGVAEKRPKDSRMAGSKIEDEEEEVEIFSKKGKMGSSGDTQGAQVGRRFEKHHEISDEYKPHMEYSIEAEIHTNGHDNDDDDDDDDLKPSHSNSHSSSSSQSQTTIGHSHRTTAADAENYHADDDEMRPSYSKAKQPAAHQTSSSSQQSLAQKKTDSAQ